MTCNWNNLEGVSLAGSHWLKRCVASTPDDAWFLTRFKTHTDAAVRVLPADAPAAEEQLAVWREAMSFDHPNIVRMLDAGHTQAEGLDIIYAVCEYPDDFLTAVLAERPLSPAEAREVLRATLSALAFIHGHGLVHCGVATEHIMAFGDTIKLPSDTIRRAGPNATAADDMRAFGITLHEILTRDRPTGENDVLDLPEPFGPIVRNTVRLDPAQRWTVRDIEKYLNPPAPVAPPPEPVAMPAPKPVAVPPPSPRVRVSEPARSAAPRPESAPQPAPAPVPMPAPRHHPREETLVNRGFPLKWVPIVGLVAAGALGAVFLRHSDQPKPLDRPAPAVRPAPVGHPAPAVRPSPAPAVAPPPHVAPERPAPTPRLDQAAVWRVVVFTFNTRAAAEKKAQSINQKHPGLNAEVFAPKGNRAPYFISLGGRMTLAQAERLKKEARAKGQPRDTFVRNFSN